MPTQLTIQSFYDTYNLLKRCLSLPNKSIRWAVGVPSEKDSPVLLIDLSPFPTKILFDFSQAVSCTLHIPTNLCACMCSLVSFQTCLLSFSHYKHHKRSISESKICFSMFQSDKVIIFRRINYLTRGSYEFPTRFIFFICYFLLM